MCICIYVYMYTSPYFVYSLQSHPAAAASLLIPPEKINIVSVCYMYVNKYAPPSHITNHNAFHNPSSTPSPTPSQFPAISAG